MRSDRAIFLDRDGVIIPDYGYFCGEGVWDFKEGVIDFLRWAQDKGFRLIIYSNQSGVARGYFEERDVWRFDRKLREGLKRENVVIERSFYAFYHPYSSRWQYKCDSVLRKPNPGFLYLAARLHGVNLRASLLVGDSWRDVEAGVRAGVFSVLLCEVPPEGYSGVWVRDFTELRDLVAHQLLKKKV